MSVVYVVFCVGNVPTWNQGFRTCLRSAKQMENCERKIGSTFVYEDISSGKNIRILI